MLSLSPSVLLFVTLFSKVTLKEFPEVIGSYTVFLVVIKSGKQYNVFH